jgi:hypothetical protein
MANVFTVNSITPTLPHQCYQNLTLSTRLPFHQLAGPEKGIYITFLEVLNYTNIFTLAGPLPVYPRTICRALARPTWTSQTSILKQVKAWQNYEVTRAVFRYYLTLQLRAPRARCSVVILQARRSRVRFPMRSLDFSIDLIILAALRPWGRLSL